MSFADAIGKLQGILSSLGTEETKKIEKKDDIGDNSVFASALQDVNEEADITGIEIDYSQAADEVAEQLFINKEIHRNSEEAKEWKERVQEELKDANIPETLKDELAPLYGQLCEASAPEQREYITAKIKQKYLEAEATGSDGTDLEKLDLNLQRYASFSAQGKMISELNQKLGETTDSKQRFRIQTEIEKTYADFSIEQNKLFMQTYIREHDLSDEQVNGLSDLYLQLGEASDENSRAAISAKIDKFCAEQEIDRNSELMIVLDKDATEIHYKEKLSNLYEEMINTTSSKQIDMIGRQINLVQSEQFIKSDEYEQKLSILEMGLDEKTKEEVLDLLDSLKGNADRNKADYTNAKIANILIESGIDLNGREYNLFLLSSTNLQMEKEQHEVYEQILNETDSKKLEYYNNKLRVIYENNKLTAEEIHKRLDDFYNKQDAERLAEMYEELSNTTNAEDRKIISNQIKDMIDEQNKTLLENKILDSYWNLYESTDEAEQARTIAEIQSLHSEYKDMKLEERLSSLYDDLSEATDINSRERIRAEIKEVENEMNKKAKLESLYEELTECASVAEREKILAKIKELE